MSIPDSWTTRVGSIGRALASHMGDWVSKLSRVILKTQKMVLAVLRQALGMRSRARTGQLGVRIMTY